MQGADSFLYYISEVNSMSLFKPKSKIILNDTLKSELDNFEVDSGKGASVYTHKKEEKRTTFADMVGDDVFFENKDLNRVDNDNLDKGIKSGVKDTFVEIIVLIGVLTFAISLFFVIFKYIV